MNGVYAMWLGQIARQASRTKVCIDNFGHTSKTGTEDANETLSIRRAAAIKQRIGTESTGCAQHSGVGLETRFALSRKRSRALCRDRHESTPTQCLPSRASFG